MALVALLSPHLTATTRTTKISEKKKSKWEVRLPFYSLRNNKGQQYDRNANFQVEWKNISITQWMKIWIYRQRPSWWCYLRQLATKGMHNYILLNFRETHREGFQKNISGSIYVLILFITYKLCFSHFSYFIISTYIMFFLFLKLF